MTDREILLDLLPGCTPDKGARTFAATRLPGGAWMFVTDGLVQCSDLGLNLASADKAREAIAAHFEAWCDLVNGPETA